MKYKEFITKLPIQRTKDSRGNGIRLDIALYVYPDGHGNFYFFDKERKFARVNNQNVAMPSNSPLEIVDIFIDILYEMQLRAKGIRKT